MEILDRIVEEIQKSLNSLFENWTLVLWQLLATIVLIIGVRFLLWKPITKYLEERQNALSRELHDAKAEKDRVAKIKEETLKEYESVKLEARGLKESIIKEAQVEKERIIKEARNEAKRRMSQVEHDVQQEIREANDKLKQTIKEIAFTAAEKIVQHEINEEVHEDMLNELIDDKL